MNIRQQLLDTFMDIQSMLNTYNTSVDRYRRVRITEDTMLIAASVIVGLGGTEQPKRKKAATKPKAEKPDDEGAAAMIAEVQDGEG